MLPRRAHWGAKPSPVRFQEGGGRFGLQNRRYPAPNLKNCILSARLERIGTFAAIGDLCSNRRQLRGLIFRPGLASAQQSREAPTSLREAPRRLRAAPGSLRKTSGRLLGSLLKPSESLPGVSGNLPDVRATTPPPRAHMHVRIPGHPYENQGRPGLEGLTYLAFGHENNMC